MIQAIVNMSLQTIFAVSANEARQFDTDQLRQHFAIENLMVPGQLQFTYTHYDRMMVGGAVPTTKKLSLPNYPSLKADYFLERRELGIINVGGNGEVTVDGKKYTLRKLDCLYVGKGHQKVTFASTAKKDAAKFYLLSCPAHHAYPVQLCKKENASPTEMGALETSNHRTIYKYIHLAGLQSCQLVMGLTILKTGSVWNTMPAHVHDRRMEAYFYFDVPADQRVFHFMGEPSQTRHLILGNDDAVVSPPWSIHSGCGTSNYSFIWGMCGENLDYSDMDKLAMNELK